MKQVSLLFLMLCMTLMGFAQSAETRLATVQDGEYDGYDIVTVFDSTSVMMEESGLSHVYNHKLWKILTDNGARDFNTVKMDYDPLSAYVEIREVVIYRKGGAREVVDLLVYDYPAPAHMIYWGARQKMVALGRLEPGDAVEVNTYKKGFTYALLQGGEDPDAKYIPPMRGHFYDIVPFWSDQPVMEKVYQVNVLASKNLRYAVYNGQLEQSQQIADGGRILYTFVKKDIMPLKTPRYTLAKNDIDTKLLLSTAKDWEAKSRWFYGVNEDYGSFVPTEEVKAKVNSLLANAKTENDSISILTHWVADNMRYSGISMGEGEGFTLHKCEMNYTDRCGVCKDKAGMLISMLRAAGFEAFAAMTMAGERIDDIPADQFNHCVTVVKRRNGNYQLLDPTWVPGVRELWSSAEQQQNFLMGLPQGATLGKTPVSRPENHYLKMTADTKVKKDGTLSGTVTITAEGQSDRAVRSVFSGRKSEWRDNVEAQMRNIYPNVRLRSVKYTDEETYLEHPVKITYKFDIPHYATVSEREVIVTPLVARGLYKFAMRHLYYDTSLEKRDYPFSDRCSRQVVLTETMTLPSGYTSAKMPKYRKLDGKDISFSGGYKFENNKFVFQENIRLGKRVYEASDWPAYRTVVQNQEFFQNTPLIVVKPVLY
ncbi:MAG: DUF3857 and transglutaminase domain-containing protein [Bacteroidales bacterium]|nr:DUF3857 and transglutaminase domain-containing protein [Bacteroidales bacterium]